MQNAERMNGGAVMPYDAFRENPNPPTTVGRKWFTAAAVYVAYSVAHSIQVLGSRRASIKPWNTEVSSAWSCCFWSFSEFQRT